jgi:hypothetical protein
MNFSRDDWIRTSDPLHPMQVRYRAALRPEIPAVPPFFEHWNTAKKGGKSTTKKGGKSIFLLHQNTQWKASRNIVVCVNIHP